MRTVARHKGNLNEAAKEIGLRVELIKSVIQRNAQLYTFEIQKQNEQHLNNINEIFDKLWVYIKKKVSDDPPTWKELAYIVKALSDVAERVKTHPIQITETTEELSWESLSNEEQAILDRVSMEEHPELTSFSIELTKSNNGDSE